MSKTAIRRADIINYLYFVNERVTTPELAKMYRVGLRTIERDIAEISLRHHITTEQGRKGGIHLRKEERCGKLSQEEFKLLYQIWEQQEDEIERRVLHSLICRLGPSGSYI